MITTVKDSVIRNLRILATATLPALLFFQVADASYPPIYDVEIIVYLNNNDRTGSENLNTTGINYPPGDGRPFPEGEFTELSYKFYQLKGISESLQESSDYNVLFHRAWRQIAYNSNEAVPYPLDSLVSDDRKSVAGSVKLELEQDLYLDINVLLMSSKIPGDSASKRPIRQLVEKQQVNSDQIYYIDHPYLKMIAKVTPFWKAGISQVAARKIFPSAGNWPLVQ